MKKMTVILLLTLWLGLTAFAWVAPAKESSDAERRPLAQMPQVSLETLLNGKFMVDFENYAVDQFPMRDPFRTVKSLFHYYVLGQKDNNSIYIADGYAAKQEYPADLDSIRHAAERFAHLYEKYLKDSQVHMAIVPDKGYYLAEGSGNLTLDHHQMVAAFQEAMPWAAQIDLTGSLSIEDYYRTDTHWRQENLVEAAGVICEALGVSAPKEEDFVRWQLNRPFYGVYYGQAALPMEPETMYVMESGLLKNCSVYDFESGKTLGIYDESKLEGKDMYEVFLSGPRSLLTIENPAGIPGKELIVFRDSFGSAMVPLILQDYAKVTVIDIRYIQIDMLDRFVEFTDQDVLLLYSTLVLNNSQTIK